VRRIIVGDETGEEIITRFSYDSAGRLWRVESGVAEGQSFTADQWVSYEFDEAGNIIAELRESRDAPQNDIVTERVFDAYNHIDTIARGGVTVDLEFNPDGSLAARTDGNGNTTAYTYDAFRRLTSTRHLGQLMSTLTYDPHGNQLTVTDPNNLATHYLYDDLGNRIEKQSPDSGTTVYRHNGSGQVISQTDALGQQTEVTYDAAG
jgi:YD repeat-containing protein